MFIMRSRYGTNIPVDTQYWNEYSVFGFVDFRLPALGKNHSIDAFKKAWNLEW